MAARETDCQAQQGMLRLGLLTVRRLCGRPEVVSSWRTADTALRSELTRPSFCAERLEGGSLAPVVAAELIFLQRAAWAMLRLLDTQALAMLVPALPNASSLVPHAGHASPGVSSFQGSR